VKTPEIFPWKRVVGAVCAITPWDKGPDNSRGTAKRMLFVIFISRHFKNKRLFSTLCDNFGLWNPEVLIGQDF
jgi:hypothetical protein